MASILELIKHYQHGIEKYSKDENKILKCIDKLYHLGVNVGHLQETGVGRTVNALRKEPGNVGTAARALVNKWKLMVASEENSEPEDHNHDATNYNGHGHGKDSDDNLNQSRNGGDRSEHETSRYTKETDHRHMNGNYSDNKRKYNSEDSEPDTKKSRQYSSPEVNVKPDVKIKLEPQSESESEQSDSQSDDSDSSEVSQDEKQTIPKIKTELSENHQSSSKYASNTHQQEIKKEPKDYASKKSHESENISNHQDEAKHSKHASKDKSSTHKSSKDKENSSERKHRSEQKASSSEKDRSSSSKHSSDRHRSSSQKLESSSDKQRSSTEKHESKSDKHRSSSQSDKDKKSSHDKEKHRSKETSSSSKEKHSSSYKEKSRDTSISSKEKSSHSHSKSEKKHFSSSDKSKSRSDKSGDSREKEEKHKSSSSHKSSKSSSSKTKEEVSKKKKSQSEDNDNGIDCESGASFAEALGMVSPVKPKKKILLGPKELSSPYNSFENQDLGPAALLAPTAKLAPLPPLEISALPEISPNYKPRPPPRLLPHFTDEDAMSASISSKNQRTKVYSGVKTYGKVPTLYEACVQVLQEHIEALEYTGGVPYEILKPVVDRATPQQLFMLEHFNPYLMDDTDHLWQKFCEKHFRNQKRQEMETWREMYMRCQEEQESRLKSLTANIRMTQEAKKAPIKQTKMAYVDTVVKPPRNIARKQALHGTARAAAASPAARVAALSSAANVVRAGSVRPPAALAAPAAALARPKKAPLMQKALQFMRGRKR